MLLAVWLGVVTHSIYQDEGFWWAAAWVVWLGVWWGSKEVVQARIGGPASTVVDAVGVLGLMLMSGVSNVFRREAPDSGMAMGREYTWLIFGTIAFMVALIVVWWACVAMLEKRRGGSETETGYGLLVGSEGVVIEPIGPGSKLGVVEIGGKRWRAASHETMQTGIAVRVLRVTNGIVEV